MLSSKGVESSCKAGHLALGQKMRNIHSVIWKRKAKEGVLLQYASLPEVRA